MVVAPELFQSAHAHAALECLESTCMNSNGGKGIATLARGDMAYRPVYDNSDASEDSTTAGGWNYHQGPEWLWPFGYYLRARLLFFTRPPTPAWVTKPYCSPHTPPPPSPSPHGTPHTHATKSRWLYSRLEKVRLHMEESEEGGLPELTNAGDSFCKDSCTVQAWSGATVLDALYDLHVLQRVDNHPPPLVR